MYRHNKAGAQDVDINAQDLTRHISMAIMTLPRSHLFQHRLTMSDICHAQGPFADSIMRVYSVGQGSSDFIAGCMRGWRGFTAMTKHCAFEPCIPCRRYER